MKNIFSGVQTLIQFALALAQLIGVFVVKPQIFDQFGHQNPFPAGDPGLYILFIISAASLVLILIYNKKKHFRIWVCVALICIAGFGYSLVKYNSNLAKKTFLVPNTGTETHEVIRVIKGNEYLPEIRRNCALLAQSDGRTVKEFDVIQQCADIHDWSEIDRLWPRNEILDNTNILLMNYYLCIFLGSISLIAIVQSLKCHRNDIL